MHREGRARAREIAGKMAKTDEISESFRVGFLQGSRVLGISYLLQFC